MSQAEAVNMLRWATRAFLLGQSGAGIVREHRLELEEAISLVDDVTIPNLQERGE